MSAAIKDHLRPRRPVGVTQSEVERLHPGAKPTRKVVPRTKQRAECGRLPPPEPLEPKPKRKIIPASEAAPPTVGRWPYPIDGRRLRRLPVRKPPPDGPGTQ